MSFYEDVPDGNYMLFYTFRGNYCSNFLAESTAFLSDMKKYTEIGASVDSLKNYTVIIHILFFRKGDPGSVIKAFLQMVGLYKS